MGDWYRHQVSGGSLTLTFDWIIRFRIRDIFDFSTTSSNNFDGRGIDTSGVFSGLVASSSFQIGMNWRALWVATKAAFIVSIGLLAPAHSNTFLGDVLWR